jgi:hypothetical protein
LPVVKAQIASLNVLSDTYCKTVQAHTLSILKVFRYFLTSQTLKVLRSTLTKLANHLKKATKTLIVVKATMVLATSFDLWFK